MFVLFSSLFVVIVVLRACNCQPVTSTCACRVNGVYSPNINYRKLIFSFAFMWNNKYHLFCHPLLNYLNCMKKIQNVQFSKQFKPLCHTLSADEYDNHTADNIMYLIHQLVNQQTTALVGW